MIPLFRSSVQTFHARLVTAAIELHGISRVHRFAANAARGVQVRCGNGVADCVGERFAAVRTSPRLAVVIFRTPTTEHVQAPVEEEQLAGRRDSHFTLTAPRIGWQNDRLGNLTFFPARFSHGGFLKSVFHVANPNKIAILEALKH